MTHLGFLAKGQTFFRIVAPLVVAADRMGIGATLVVYKGRPGKPEDDASPAYVKQLMGLAPGIEVLWARDDGKAEAILASARCDAVVCQDAPYHYPFLSPRPERVFSAGAFTDTLHWAAGRVQRREHVGAFPRRTYFATEGLRQKAEELLRQPWPGSVALGSPMLDQAMWLRPSERFEPGSVVFLAPPADILPDGMPERLAALAAHVRSKGGRFVVKDKRRMPWPELAPGMERCDWPEQGMPYASLRLMSMATVCVSSYSIAAFEAEFLGRPTINLGLRPEALETHMHRGNVQVASYGLDGPYGLWTCPTVTGDLVEAYEQLLLVQRPVARDVGPDGSHSEDILLDVLRELGERERA